jgi:glycosidase
VTKGAGELLPRGHAGGVTFTFAPPAGVGAVSVAGTFDCWDPTVHRLARAGGGRWTTTFPVAPGRHLYKYVLDDRDWIADPANAWRSEDGQGNSCFTVDDRGEVLLRPEDFSADHPGSLYARRAALRSPDWIRDAVLYALSAPAFAGGGLTDATRRLPYLQELGATVVWLMPVHPVGRKARRGERGDPYAVRDFLAVDPALGTEDDLRAFVREAHRLGLRVVLDWALNRSSVDNPLTEAHPEWFTRDAAGAVRYAVPGRVEFAGFDFAAPGLRRYLVDAFLRWLRLHDLDGFRLDDSDLTPLDFLDELRRALQAAQPDVALISQSYDELHHLAACDLTYEGATRDLVRAIADGQASAADFARAWRLATFSFPRGALRMRWLEEKEQGRAFRFLGAGLHQAAASLLLTLDGVPFILMGQEWNEPRWTSWTSLFEPFALDWSAFDRGTHAHYRGLIALRGGSPALRRGTVDFVETSSPQVVAFVRRVEGEALLVAVNLSDRDLPDLRLGAGQRLPPETVYAHAPGQPRAAGGPGVAAFGTVVCRLR